MCNDKKRDWCLIGLGVPSLARGAVVSFALTTFTPILWLCPIVILVIVPAIDLMTGLDRSNPPDDVIEELENDKYYRWITYLFLPIQYVGFVGAMMLIGGSTLWGLIDDPMTLWQEVGIAVSIGAIGGIGINTAHELGHKKEIGRAHV